MSIPHHPLFVWFRALIVSSLSKMPTRRWGCLRRGSYLWRSRNRDHLRHCDLSHQARWYRNEGRRTWHQYYARGGFVRSALPQTNRYVRPPSPPLTDWNLIPKRLAEHADPAMRLFFSHWNTAQCEWVARGYDPLFRAEMPRGEVTQ